MYLWSYAGWIAWTFFLLKWLLAWTVLLCSWDTYDVLYSYLFMYPLHKFNIQWFQTMSGWSNEIQAYMDSWISDWKSFHFGFRIQEIIILIFHIFDNWIPAFRIIDSIAETCKNKYIFILVTTICFPKILKIYA